MNDKMYDFMAMVLSVADSTGRFNAAEVSQNDENVQFLMDARDRGWIHIESGNHYVTRTGMEAFSSGKDVRDQAADAAAHEAKGRVKKKVADIALAIVTAALAAVAGAVVTHWLQ